MKYYVKRNKAYYVQSADGYTRKEEEAGQFTIDDLKGLNLDGCTLYEVLEQRKKEKEEENIATEAEYAAILMVEIIAKSELNSTESLALYGILQTAKFSEKVDLFGGFFTVDKEFISGILQVEIDVIDQTLMKLLKSQSICESGDNEYFIFPF